MNAANNLFLAQQTPFSLRHKHFFFNANSVFGRCKHCFFTPQILFFDAANNFFLKQHTLFFHAVNSGFGAQNASQMAVFCLRSPPLWASLVNKFIPPPCPSTQWTIWTVSSQFNFSLTPSLAARKQAPPRQAHFLLLETQIHSAIPGWSGPGLTWAGLAWPVKPPGSLRCISEHHVSCPAPLPSPALPSVL